MDSDLKLRNLVIGKTIADIMCDSEGIILVFTDGQTMEFHYEVNDDHNERDGQ